MEERPRATDDFATIRVQMEELKHEREAEDKRAKRAAVEEEKLRRIIGGVEVEGYSAPLAGLGDA